MARWTDPPEKKGNNCWGETTIAEKGEDGLEGGRGVAQWEQRRGGGVCDGVHGKRCDERRGDWVALVARACDADVLLSMQSGVWSRGAHQRQTVWLQASGD